MPKNILITHKVPDITVSMLQDRGYIVDVNIADKILSEEELKNLLNQKAYDGVVTLLTDKITDPVMSAAPNLKIISNFASGYDNVDIQSARTHNITVANAPTPETSQAVAEHTMALILALSSHIVEADKFVRAHKYHGWDPMLFVGEGLNQKSIGIVGVGRIGMCVAKFARAFGMNVLYHDLKPNQELENLYQGKFFASLDELLKVADVVSLHVPLLPSTTHLINAKNLPLMKKSSILINTARGKVIDELALIQALKNGLISFAGLDVFEFEPEVNQELLALDNVVLTPHISSANHAVREAMGKVAAENLIDFFEGREVKNKIN